MITNPREQLINLLTVTQRNWLLAMEYPSTGEKQSLHAVVSNFSAAWYLRALIEGHDLQETCTHLAEILHDGGGIGEWTWELLSQLGIDPATITSAKPVMGSVAHHPI